MDIALFCRKGKLSRMKIMDFFEAILKLEAEFPHKLQFSALAVLAT